MSVVVPHPAVAAAAGPVSPFDFGPDFESKVAALAVRDERFARESLDFLKPEHFTNAVERNLVLLAQRFTQSYGTPPSLPTLVDLVLREPSIGAAERGLYAAKIRELAALDLREREYIRSRTVDFCKRQALLLVAAAIPDLLKKNRLEEIGERVNRAMAMGSENVAQFIDYFAQAHARKERREALATGKIVPGVPTGFPEIDDRLYRKGWGRGELTVVMAPAKRGKTALLTQTALAGAVMHGTRALDLSLEVDEDILADRADASLANVTMDQLVAQRDAVAAKVAMYSGGKGKFWIERRPANTVTTDQVDQLVEAYFNSGRPIDLLVVDYIGILRLKPADDRFVGLGNAAKELRRIAGKYNIAVLTGAQTNRDAVGKQLAGMDSIGESFAIVQDCDLLLSINANDQEMAAGVRRIYFAASRNNPELTFRVKGDLGKMQLIQEVLGVEY